MRWSSVPASVTWWEISRSVRTLKRRPPTAKMLMSHSRTMTVRGSPSGPTKCT